MARNIVAVVIWRESCGGGELTEPELAIIIPAGLLTREESPPSLLDTSSKLASWSRVAATFDFLLLVGQSLTSNLVFELAFVVWSFLDPLEALPTRDSDSVSIASSSSSSSNKIDSKCSPLAKGLEESRLKSGLGGDVQLSISAKLLSIF